MSTQPMLPSPREVVASPTTGPDHGDVSRLEALVEEWLLGYRSEATRLSYGDALGLARPWVRDLGRNRVGRVDASGTGVRPPVRTGRFRDLAWLRWCAANGLHPLVVTGVDVKRWLEALAAAGMAKSSRAHRLAAVAEFYRFLVERGALDANPAAFDRRGLQLGTGSDTSSTVVLTASQVRVLLTVAGTQRRGVSPVMRLRSRAIVALFTLGLRVAELTALRRQDLHTTRGRAALRVTGKGDKTRVVFLSGLAEQSLSGYLAERDRHRGAALPARVGQVGSRHEPLIATGDGSAMNTRDVWALIRRLARAAGPELAAVADRMGPHTLRHFYVTAAAEGGADMTHVQADVGHASVETTHRVYNQATRAPERSAVDIVEQALLRSDPAPPDRVATVTALERLAHDLPGATAEVTAILARLAGDALVPADIATAAHEARRRIAGGS